MQFTSIVGLVASIFTGISLMPQLVKILKEKDAETISLGMLAALFIGLCGWIYYGILKEDWIIIIANSFSVIINILIWIFSLKYRKEAESSK